MSPRALAQLGTGLETILAGHHDVHQDDTGALLLKQSQPFFSVGRLDDIEPRPVKRLFDQETHVVLVVVDQYKWAFPRARFIHGRNL